MLNLKLENKNEPMLTYEVVADLGENGTKTIYTGDSLSEVYAVIDQIELGNLDIPCVDLTEDELELIETIGIDMIVTPKELDLITYENEQSSITELQ